MIDDHTVAAALGWQPFAVLLNSSRCFMWSFKAHTTVCDDVLGLAHLGEPSEGLLFFSRRKLATITCSYVLTVHHTIIPPFKSGENRKNWLFYDGAFTKADAFSYRILLSEVEICAAHLSSVTIIYMYGHIPSDLGHLSLNVVGIYRFSYTQTCTCMLSSTTGLCQKDIGSNKRCC